MNEFFDVARERLEERLLYLAFKQEVEFRFGIGIGIGRRSSSRIRLVVSRHIFYCASITLRW